MTYETATLPEVEMWPAPDSVGSVVVGGGMVEEGAGGTVVVDVDGSVVVVGAVTVTCQYSDPMLPKGSSLITPTE